MDRPPLHCRISVSFSGGNLESEPVRRYFRHFSLRIEEKGIGISAIHNPFIPFRQGRDDMLHGRIAGPEDRRDVKIRDEIVVEVLSFSDALTTAPPADLEIFSLPQDPDFKQIRETIEKTRTSCLFCRDSEQESALI
jgi:hypothetical protein